MEFKIFKSKKICITAIIFVAACLLLTSTFAPAGVAVADENSNWQYGYDNYLSTLSNTDGKDWYFAEDYLNLNGAKEAASTFLSDINFDRQALKEDPIVIAVIDSGIGHAYKTNGTEVSPINVYNSGVEYSLHPIFDKVLLKDKDGNYIYKNLATSVTVDKSFGDSSLSGVVTNSGNIALDLVDNTSNDHGTHVTGTVAMLIHMLGLEEYIKILPIKANNILKKDGTSYTASYSSSVVEPAVQYAYEQGADIVSMSLTADKNYKDRYDFSTYSDDMVIVAAAGNGGSNIEGYPAAHSNVLGVMNYTMSDDGGAVLSESSNYGTWYDIAAPGAGIISSVDGDDYGKLSGTSMATPITALACALTYFRHRGYSNQFDEELTSKDVRELIPLTATDMTDDMAYPMLNLKSVLLYNYNTEVINIICGGKSQYKLGETDEITFAANLPTDYAPMSENIVWWYEHDGETVEIGIGRTATMSFPDEIGTYSVKCAVVDMNGNVYLSVGNAYTITVEYCTLDDMYIECRDYIGENMIRGNSYVFYVPTEYMDPSVAVEVQWYVNGEKVSEGNEFTFTPTEIGEFAVGAVVNGRTIAFEGATTVAEEYSDGTDLLVFIATMLKLASYVVSIISLVVSAVIIVVLSIYLAKEKRKDENQFDDGGDDSPFDELK